MSATHFLSDTADLTGRSMRHITRSVDTIITTAVTPIAIMVLFVYVFGGAIDTGTENYVDYLLPGILLIAIASGIAYTAVRLFTDLQSGIFERFHSMPISRPSVLWAHVLTSLASNGDHGRDHRAGRPPHGVPHLGRRAGLARRRRDPGAVHAGAHLGRRHRRPVGEVGGRRRGVLLPADLPAVHQLGLRPDRHHAGPGARLRGEPAGHVDRRHDPGRCSPGSRSAATSGSPSPGASASSSSPTCFAMRVYRRKIS